MISTAPAQLAQPTRTQHVGRAGLAGVGRGLDGVLHEVDDDLLDLRGVAARR